MSYKQKKPEGLTVQPPNWIHRAAFRGDYPADRVPYTGRVALITEDEGNTMREEEGHLRMGEELRSIKDPNYIETVMRRNPENVALQRQKADIILKRILPGLSLPPIQDTIAKYLD